MAHYLTRVGLAALGILTALAVILCVTLTTCVSYQETPDTWRDGFCIWTCEPLNGPALDHKLWKGQNGRWLCECSDGHVYVVPG